MARCLICGAEINENNSTEEHIILNAIGGRLKTKNLLCKTHNSAFGDKCDAELANQLKVFSTLFQVPRQRGKNQNIIGITNTGKQYNLQDGRNPELAKPTVEIKDLEKGGHEIHIEARTGKEALQKLKELKAKFPNWNIDIGAAMAQSKKVVGPFNDYLNFQCTFGGDLAFRSIVKTVVEYYVLTTGDRETVRPLIPYLKGEKNLEICRLFTTLKPVYKLLPEEVCHVIHVESNTMDNLLYAYVEFYSTISYVVLLSDHYEGPDVNYTYCFDLVKVKEVDKSISLGLTKKSINILHKQDEKDRANITSRTNRFLGICKRRSFEAELRDIIERDAKGSAIFAEDVINKIAEDVSVLIARYCYNEEANY